MRLWAWLRAAICPTCGPDEPHSTLATMERTAAALKSLHAEVRSIRAEMAADDNPLLGEKPRAPRRRRR